MSVWLSSPVCQSFSVVSALNYSTLRRRIWISFTLRFLSFPFCRFFAFHLANVLLGRPEWGVGLVLRSDEDMAMSSTSLLGLLVLTSLMFNAHNVRTSIGRPRTHTRHAMFEPWKVKPWFICHCTAMYKPWLNPTTCLNQGSPWSYHSKPMVKLWYHDRFCHGTPILVNLHKSPKVDKRFSKSRSRIIIIFFTYTPYNYYAH